MDGLYCQEESNPARSCFNCQGVENSINNTPQSIAIHHLVVNMPETALAPQFRNNR